jgi:hypothetical protein
LNGKYPGENRYFYGCISHALHLLVKDIFTTVTEEMRDEDTARDNRIRIPENAVQDDIDALPFAWLDKLLKSTNDACIFFRKHHYENAVLLEANEKYLKLPGDTRWGSIQGMLESFKSNLASLHEIVDKDEFTQRGTSQKDKAHRRQIQSFILSPGLRTQLTRAVLLSSPINALIVKFQSNEVPISEAYAEMRKLGSTYGESAYNFLSTQEKEFVQECVLDRWNFICADCHGAAYLLDPRYMGAGMSRTQRRIQGDFEKMVSYIESIWERKAKERGSADEKATLSDELTEFISWEFSEEEKKKKYCSENRNPMKFWKDKKGQFPRLYQIAETLFSLVPSSASAERNFSAMGLTQTKLRNRLLRSSKSLFIS